MIRPPSLIQTFEAAVTAVGHSFPRLSELFCEASDLKPPLEFPVSGLRTSYYVLDIAFCDKNTLHLIEANGSNANLTSVPLGHDDYRTDHMAFRFRSTLSDRGPNVALIPFSDRFIHIAEYFARLHSFASKLPSNVRIRGPREALGPEQTSVVWGRMSELVPLISMHEERLLYRDRPIAFATNPGLLAELTRRGLIATDRADFGEQVFHDGRGLSVVLDKALQQQLCAQTGITPLKREVGRTLVECRMILDKYAQSDVTLVGKVNAGSGAVGIGFFPPTISAIDSLARLEDMFDDARAKYGEYYETTLYPITFFEFARSRPASLPDGDHYWDLRVECIVYPDRIQVLPGLVRICPAPFDGSYGRETVVSNLTGRGASLEFTRSIVSRATREELDVSIDQLLAAAQACKEWCVGASRMPS